MATKDQVRVTLRDIAGVIATNFIGAADFTPDAEPQDNVHTALFEVVTDGGISATSSLIYGDDWREIASNCRLDDIALCVRAGCRIDRAVSSAVEGCDPDGFDTEMLDEYESLQRDRDAMQAVLDMLKSTPLLVYVASFDVRNGGSGVEVFATKELAIDAVIAWAEDRLTGENADKDIDHESAAGASVEQARAFIAEHGHLNFGSADCYYHVTEQIVRGSAPLIALANAAQTAA